MGAGLSQEQEPELQTNQASINGSNSEAKTEEKQNDFKATAMETTVSSKLPYNYESIVRTAVTPLDNSSIDKLYDQLYSGVYLSQRTKKYWVDKKCKSNCFMLFARDLSITWVENNHYWTWTSLKETSAGYTDVAELLNVCWLEVHGKLNTAMLSPGVLYEVGFMIMMKDQARGWNVPVNVRLVLPDGTKQESKENMTAIPKGQLVEIPVGNFETSTKNVGDIEVSMFEYEGGKWKSGLVIVAIVIQPKH